MTAAAIQSKSPDHAAAISPEDRWYGRSWATVFNPRSNRCITVTESRFRKLPACKRDQLMRHILDLLGDQYDGITLAGWRLFRFCAQEANPLLVGAIWCAVVERFPDAIRYVERHAAQRAAGESLRLPGCERSLRNPRYLSLAEIER